MGSDKNSDVVDEKHVDGHGHVDKVSTKEVDTAAQLVAGKHYTLEPEEARRIRYVKMAFEYGMSLTSRRRRKIDIHILPLMCGTHSLTIDFPFMSN